MSGGLRIGRIRGIAITLHWSLIPIFGLIADGLATSMLPALVPGQSWAAYWAGAVVATALFYAGLLAHELGHSEVARSRGLAVESITIWLFGGVARLKGEAPTPGSQAFISLAGPAVSVGIAVVFALISFSLQAVNALLPAAVAAWMAAINLILAAFNLVPAFPLDGGRVLQAILWRRTGNRTHATVIAARTGKVFGYLMIGGGVLEVVLGGDLGGIWIGLLGLFLLGAAGAEEGQVELVDALGDIQVGDVMSPDPILAPDWITVAEFIRSYVLVHRVTAFPVKDFDGRLKGLVTLKQVAELPEEARATTRVADLAMPLSAVPIAAAHERLVDLLTRMDGKGGGRALVFDGDKLVGIISPSDVTMAVTRSRLAGRKAA